VHISEDLRLQLMEEIHGLMHHWHPNAQTADYCCEFCGDTADTNQGSIEHQDGCVGVKFLEELSKNENTADCLAAIVEHVMES
jgi:hypothetical protein